MITTCAYCNGYYRCDICDGDGVIDDITDCQECGGVGICPWCFEGEIDNEDDWL